MEVAPTSSERGERERERQPVSHVRINLDSSMHGHANKMHDNYIYGTRSTSTSTSGKGWLAAHEMATPHTLPLQCSMESELGEANVQSSAEEDSSEEEEEEESSSEEEEQQPSKVL